MPAKVKDLVHNYELQLRENKIPNIIIQEEHTEQYSNVVQRKDKFTGFTSSQDNLYQRTEKIQTNSAFKAEKDSDERVSEGKRREQSSSIAATGEGTLPLYEYHHCRKANRSQPNSTSPAKQEEHFYTKYPGSLATDTESKGVSAILTTKSNNHDILNSATKDTNTRSRIGDYEPDNQTTPSILDKKTDDYNKQPNLVTLQTHWYNIHSPLQQGLQGEQPNLMETINSSPKPLYTGNQTQTPSNSTDKTTISFPLTQNYETPTFSNNSSPVENPRNSEKRAPLTDDYETPKLLTTTFVRKPSYFKSKTRINHLPMNKCTTATIENSFQNTAQQSYPICDSVFTQAVVYEPAKETSSSPTIQLSTSENVNTFASSYKTATTSKVQNSLVYSPECETRDKSLSHVETDDFMKQVDGSHFTSRLEEFNGEAQAEEYKLPDILSKTARHPEHQMDIFHWNDNVDATNYEILLSDNTVRHSKRLDPHCCGNNMDAFSSGDRMANELPHMKERQVSNTKETSNAHSNDKTNIGYGTEMVSVQKSFPPTKYWKWIGHAQQGRTTGPSLSYHKARYFDDDKDSHNQSETAKQSNLSSTKKRANLTRRDFDKELSSSLSALETLDQSPMRRSPKMKNMVNLEYYDINSDEGLNDKIKRRSRTRSLNEEQKITEQGCRREFKSSDDLRFVGLTKNEKDDEKIPENRRCKGDKNKGSPTSNTRRYMNDFFKTDFLKPRTKLTPQDDYFHESNNVYELRKTKMLKRSQEEEKRVRSSLVYSRVYAKQFDHTKDAKHDEEDELDYTMYPKQDFSANQGKYNIAEAEEYWNRRHGKSKVRQGHHQTFDKEFGKLFQDEQKKNTTPSGSKKHAYPNRNTPDEMLENSARFSLFSSATRENNGSEPSKDFSRTLNQLSSYVLNVYKDTGTELSQLSETPFIKRYHLDDETDLSYILDDHGEFQKLSMLAHAIVRLREIYGVQMGVKLLHNEDHTMRLGNAQLRDAIENKPWSVLKEIIVKHKCLDANVRSESGFSALHRAAVEGDIEVIRVLLDYGADVNNQDNCGFPPVHQALRNHHYKAAIFLMDCGTDLMQYTSKGIQQFVTVKAMAKQYLRQTLKTPL